MRVVRSIAAITIIALSPFREVRAKNCLSLIWKKASLGCVLQDCILFFFPFFLLISRPAYRDYARFIAKYQLDVNVGGMRLSGLVPFYLRNVDKFADNGYSSKVEDRVPVYALFSDLDRSLARININNRDKINTTALVTSNLARAMRSRNHFY